MRRRVAKLIAVVGAAAALFASHGTARAADEARRAPDHLAGTTDELDGWFAAAEERWVKVREIAEKILREHPESYAGNYLLGVAFHYGEGDLARSLYHLERAMRIFEGLHGATPATEGPWRWHEATLREMTFTLGEIDRPGPEIVILDKYDAAYTPKRIAQRVWPLMKLRRYEDSRAEAKRAIATGNSQQRVIARSDLCAAECEAGDRARAFAACTDALSDFRKPDSGGQVEYSNASESAVSVFRYDDAERYLKESAARATADSWGNPFQHLASLYLLEGRIPEAIAAMKGAQDLRIRRPAWLDQHGEARLDAALSELFLLTGVVDRAASAAERAVDRPDRQGVHSGTEVQSRAANDVRLATMLRELAAREEEDAVTSGMLDAAKLRARAAWHRLSAWRARRRAAVALSDENFLVRSLRPYYVGGIDLPMWLLPEAIGAVGGGVTLAGLAKAREAEAFPGTAAFFDATEAQATFDRGDCERADTAATAALARLPNAEVLLRARMAMLRGLCAERRGDPGAAAGLLVAAFARDPGLFRRLDVPLPVSIETDGSGLSDRARRLVARSPRFKSGGAVFHVRISGGRQPEACVLGPSGEQLACARVNLPEDTDDTVAARLLVAELHRAAFVLKADLTQADLTSLDGSPTAARADRQVQSLIDQLGQHDPPPPPSSGGPDPEGPADESRGR